MPCFLDIEDLYNREVGKWGFGKERKEGGRASEQERWSDNQTLADNKDIEQNKWNK